MKPSEYEAIVIGSGQAGTPLSQALAGAGMRTALVEREHVGGTCINEGCTPTKTMVASARVAYLARRGPDYGVQTSGLAIDLLKVRERKRSIVDSFRNGSQSRVQRTDRLELLFGEARWSGDRTVTVKSASGVESVLTAPLFFINAGCRPSVPKVPGLDTVAALNSTSVMELDRVPEHLVVLGGGYIGLEFGQMFRRFGSRVTVVQSGSRLLAREDSDVAEAVLSVLRDDGVEVILDAKATRAAGGGSEVQLDVDSGGKSRRIAGSHLLVATGRVPNSDTLNVKAGGIELDERGFIRTNDRLETNRPGVYALGDINGGPAFTHISYDDFRIIRTNVIEKGRASTAGRLVPYTVFIDPQLGRVGLSEEEARRRGIKIRVAKMPMSYVARALEVDESRGFMKAIVDSESGQILGAAVLGIEGGEIMSQIQIAIMGKLPYRALKDGVFAHPTLAESLNNLFSQLSDD